MIVKSNSPVVDVDWLASFFEWRFLQLLTEYWQTPPMWGRF